MINLITAIDAIRSVLVDAAVRWDVVRHPVRVDPLARRYAPNPAGPQDDRGCRGKAIYPAAHWNLPATSR